MAKPAPYLRAALLGTIAGMRSMSAPAKVANDAQRHPAQLEGTPLSPLSSSRVATLLMFFAVGEALADKFPFIPDRTAPLPLAGRAACGALTGAATFISSKKASLVGAAIGAAAAIGSSFLFRNLRVGVEKKLHVPGLIVAAAEDALVLALIRAVPLVT